MPSCQEITYMTVIRHDNNVYQFLAGNELSKEELSLWLNESEIKYMRDVDFPVEIFLDRYYLNICQDSPDCPLSLYALSTFFIAIKSFIEDYLRTEEVLP